MGVDQFAERFGENVGHHVAFVDVELLEEGLVEQPPLILAGLSVELLRVFDERESRLDDGSTDFQLVANLGQGSAGCLSFPLDVAEALAELGLRHVLICGEVEQLLLAPVEFGEGAFNTLAQ